MLLIKVFLSGRWLLWDQRCCKVGTGHCRTYPLNCWSDCEKLVGIQGHWFNSQLLLQCSPTNFKHFTPLKTRREMIYHYCMVAVGHNEIICIYTYLPHKRILTESEFYCKIALFRTGTVAYQIKPALEGPASHVSTSL